MSFVVVAGAMCQSEVRLVHADGRVCTLTPLAGGFVFDDCDLHMSLWFPILTGLAAIINHPHIDVRTGSSLGVVALVLRCADSLRSTNAPHSGARRAVQFAAQIWPDVHQLALAVNVSVPSLLFGRRSTRDTSMLTLCFRSFA